MCQVVPNPRGLQSANYCETEVEVKEPELVDVQDLPAVRAGLLKEEKQ